jgi:hypothetical protein
MRATATKAVDGDKSGRCVQSTRGSRGTGRKRAEVPGAMARGRGAGEGGRSESTGDGRRNDIDSGMEKKLPHV